MAQCRFFWRVAAVFGLLLWGVAACGQDVAPKRRVAVLNFDNPSTGSDAPSGLFGADGGDVGKGVSVQLIQKLLQGDNYIVVDRSALAKLLKEQSEVESDREDAYQLAARIGRMVGLDAMIIGAITRYGVAEKHTDGAGRLLSSGIHTRKSKAYVEITAQIFNITTGSVMASFTAAGESVRTGEITVMSGRRHGAASLTMLGSEFVDSLFPEATANAVQQIAAQLNAFAEKIPALQIAVEGVVAEAAGNTLTLNLGKKSGVKVGQRLSILREPRETDAAEVKGVERVPKIVGHATVTEVAEEYATATFSGTGEAQARAGDRVRATDIPEPAPH